MKKPSNCDALIDAAGQGCLKKQIELSVAAILLGFNLKRQAARALAHQVAEEAASTTRLRIVNFRASDFNKHKDRDG
jgi:hypothetical protein